MRTELTKPCPTCPFRKTIEPGELGGSPVEVYVGQAYLKFYVPCHELIDYSDPDWKSKAMAVPHCAGMQLFRANLGVPLARWAMTSPDRFEVFQSVLAFASHHQEIPMGEVKIDIHKCMNDEINRAGMMVRLVPSKG